MKVWSIFLYGVESWTIKRSDRKRMNSFEMWCWRRRLGVSWREHRTNASVMEELGWERELTRIVAKLKLQYFRHVVTESAGELSLAVLEGMIDGMIPRRCSINNILEWSGKTYKQLKVITQHLQSGRRYRGNIQSQQKTSAM